MADSKLPNEDKPDIKPDLPGIKDKESKAGGGFYNPKGDGSGGGSGSPLDSSALSSAEKGSSGSTAALPGEKLGSGYNPKGSQSAASQIVGVLKKRKKSALVGGGIGGAIIALVIGAFFLIIPLKIEHMVKNLEHRFFATSENAVGNETHKMMVSYIKNQIGGAMKLGKCAREGNYVISKDCTIHVAGNGSNPVVNLYKTWSQAKLENNLAEKYGIELRYDTRGRGTFLLRSPGLSRETKVGDGVSGIDGRFDAVDRGTVRNAFKSAEKNMTLWDKVMYRYKVGRLLEEKYGIKRCIAFCGTRDAFADKVQDKKYAAKAFLIERVIAPKDAALAAVMGCLFNTSATACNTQQPTTCAEPPCDELSGEAQTKADGDVASAVGSVSSAFGDETAKKLMGTVSDIRDKGGASKYLLDKLISQVFSQDIADKAVPVVGQLQTVSQVSSIIQKLANAPATLKKLTFLAGSTGAVSLYMEYRSYADEVHTGHADPTELGSFDKALGSGNQCEAAIENCSAQTQKGGNAAANNTPLYADVVNNDSGAVKAAPAVSFLNGILPSTAYAATASTQGTYTCDNGKGVPAGKMVCSEEKLGQGNGVVSSVSDALNATGLAGLASTFNGIINSFPISTILGALNSITNFFSSALETLAENTPGVSSIIDQAKSLTGKFITFLTDQLIPQPMSQDMSGGRTFDMMAAGADVSGNDYAHDGLGGKLLNKNQVASIVAEQNSQDQQQFSSEPLFARMFDTNSQYSLVSKVAMAVPFDFQNTSISSFSSLLSNPFQAINHSFASLFTGKVSATPTPQDDAFGVNQYGYTQSDLNAIGDDQAYWDKHCTDNAGQAYQTDNSYTTEANNTETQSQINDPNSFINSNQDPSGMPVNMDTNACLLIKAAVGSAGGAFDSSLLTKDDTADLNGGPGSTPPVGATGTFTNPFPGGWVPNRLDMGYDGTFKGQIVAPFAGTVTYAGPFNGWNGSSGVIIKADSDVGLPTRSLYFTEGVAPIVSLMGKDVPAGTPIANAAPSPYGDSYGQGANGAIEWGVSKDGPVGSQVDTEAIALGVCSGSAKSMVLNFAQWAHQKLNVAAPATTDNAGCP